MKQTGQFRETSPLKYPNSYPPNPQNLLPFCPQRFGESWIFMLGFRVILRNELEYETSQLHLFMQYAQQIHLLVQ